MAIENYISFRHGFALRAGPLAVCYNRHVRWFMVIWNGRRTYQTYTWSFHETLHPAGKRFHAFTDKAAETRNKT